MKNNINNLCKNPSPENRGFCFLLKLQKIFGRPFNILKSTDLTFRHKKKLLNRWQWERAFLLQQQGRGQDYIQDKEIDEVDEALQVVALQKKKKQINGRARHEPQY